MNKPHYKMIDRYFLAGNLNNYLNLTRKSRNTDNTEFVYIHI